MDTPPPAPSTALVPPADRVDPSAAGAPWWRYQRPPALVATNGNGQVAPATDGAAPDDAPDEDAAPVPKKVWAYYPPAGPLVALAAVLIVVVLAGTRGGNEDLGVYAFPTAGVLLALAFGRRCARVRPDEPWLPRLILIGVFVKIAGSLARYYTLTEAYQNAGDASIYDREARKLVAFWTGERATSPLAGYDLRQSNFIRWITGIVYYLFGQNLLAAFLLFGLIAVIGSYFWYRALADSTPIADKRLFLIFMMFAPSIVFWPSALGKEALMQMAIGAMAWATCLMFNGRFQRAIPLALGGGWLLWVVRPHLLAIATIAAAVPYFIGRLSRGRAGTIIVRPTAMIALALLVVFTIGAASKVIGLQDLSIDGIQATLDDQTKSTSYGGSSFDHGTNSITNPLYLPQGFVTVLFRPFVWETHSLFQAVAALESAVMLFFCFRRFDSIKLALRRCRREPFILYCVILVLFYSATFSSLANFGLLARQRSLVLPAFYAIISISPAIARKLDGRVVDVPDDALTAAR